MNPPAAPSHPLAFQRNVILALLLAIAAGSWAFLLWQVRHMDMADMAAMNAPTMGLRAPLFLLTWTVMMVAMMYPTAAPMILAFHRIQATRRERGEAFVSTWVFVAAYTAVWAAAGIVAYLGALAAEALAARFGIGPETAARVGGGVLILAGAYQFTPWKDICLSKCRTPVGFIMASWRDGRLGALRMGIEHGAFCLGCCWLLFAVMFPLGVMNVAAMAVITLIVFAEKTLPWAGPIVKGTAVVLILYGAATLVSPRLLPTFTAGGAMTMPMDMPGMNMKAKDAPMKPAPR